MRSRSIVILLFVMSLLLPLSDLLMSRGRENAQWILVVEGGFKDPSNTGAYSHAIFNDYLYIGTFKANSGAEIWRSHDGAAWEQVGLDGLGNPKNHGVKVFTYKDRLYVSTLNYEEGLELWISSDGENFARIASNGFEEKSIADSPYQVTFKDKLIIPGYWPGPKPARAIEIWASQDGVEFEKVVENGLGDSGNWIPFPVKPTIFHDQLYIGTENHESGGEIWRTSDGVDWERVADNGLGNPSNFILSPSIVFNDQLYAASINLQGFELFATSDGESWEKVVEKGFGYGLNNNIGGWLYESKRELYLITYDQDRRTTPAAGPLKGFQLWSSQNGEDWIQLGKNGFGNPNNFAATLNIVDEIFYVSTLNYADGCEVWRSQDKTSWERIFKEKQGRQKNLRGGGPIEFNNCLLLTIYDDKNGFDIWRYGPIRTEATTTISTTTTLMSTTTETSIQITPTEIEVGPEAADYTSILIVAAVAAAAVATTLVLLHYRRRPPPVSVEARYCLKCGAPLSASAEYCIQCGAKQKV